MLHSLRIRNYRALKDAQIAALPPLVVLVGANASGKSTVLDAIDFVAHVVREGLDSALSSRGGYENIASRRSRRARGAIEFELVYGLRAKTDDVSHSHWRYRLAFAAAGDAIDADVYVRHETLEGGYAPDGPFTLIFERSRDRQDANESYGIPDGFIRDYLPFRSRKELTDTVPRPNHSCAFLGTSACAN